ncbi:hypothetical protein DXA38_21900 [[Clostridium] innocuum]|uniref:Uncharacterized protein n=1 Tax=Clostridium innocuum TaxID=1522 RepID=A0A3E2VDJ9_CLOIN|nr:hypothetical protein DXA38_21900 [[Clostridium] innocuum]
MDIDPLTLSIIILFIANMAQAIFLLIKHMSIYSKIRWLLIVLYTITGLSIVNTLYLLFQTFTE